MRTVHAQGPWNLTVTIAALFAAFDGTYGYRRLHRELVRSGEQVGEELVRNYGRG